jgi:hypothetical protein
MSQTSLLDDYLPPEDLAAELNVTTRTLDRWRVVGSGPPLTKIGRAVYYSRKAAEWVRAREQRNVTA